MINEPCKDTCIAGHGLNTIKTQINNAIEQGKRILEGGLDWNTFTGYCADLRATMVDFFSLPSLPDQKILKLREETKNIVEVTKNMKGKLTLSRSVEDFINTCKDINTNIEQQLRNDQSETIENRLQNLNEHINDIGKIIESFKTHGVITSEANDFLQSCREIQTKLHICVSKIQNDEKMKGVNFNTDQQRLTEFLKRQLSCVEIMTQDIYEGAPSKSLESFLNACHDFREKLEGKSIVQKLPDTEADKLIKQLKEAVQLSKAAKLNGYSSKNIDSFIKHCQKINNKLTQSTTQASSSNAKAPNKQARLMNSFENNINNILNLISEMRQKGYVSDSLEELAITCNQIKRGFGVEKDVNNIQVLDIDSYMEDASCSKSCDCKTITDSRSPKGIVMNMPLQRKPKSPVSTKIPECNISCDQLGLHETRVKKIITLTRYRDKTGVMNEQTDTVVLRESSYDPSINVMPVDVEEDDVTVKSVEIESFKNLPYNNLCGAPSASFTSDKQKTVGYIMADERNHFKEARKAKSMFIFGTSSSSEPLKKHCISYSSLSKGEHVAYENENLISP